MRTKTTEGTTERGSAMQRHFVRHIDNDVEGGMVVISHGDGSVGCLVKTDESIDFLSMVEEYGFSVEYAQRWVGTSSGIEYHDIEVTF